ncbi:S1 RNA-binding domain-containing protein [Patescibacteria group bacterium]|nr:S1 RNA-binding domain-containing protein [Patescibacteria group bacterium]
MKKVLETENNLFKPPRIGEIVEGAVVGMKRAAVYLDIGIRGTGIIYGKEFFYSKDILRSLKIGDKIFVKIVDLENEDGYLELSTAQAEKEITLEALKQQKEKGETIKVKILKANKGGLMSEISGIPAFLPVSQLSSDHYPKVEGADTNKILRELQKFIGQELEVKVLNILPQDEQIIISEKIKEVDKIKKILKNYKIGDIVEGEITGLVDFGAFIKFSPSKAQRAKMDPSTKDKPASASSSGKTKENKKTPTGESSALEGLIHISELDWKIIEDPSEIVKIGQKVKAKIIDLASEKVSLSLKALKKDPWENIKKKYKKGDIVKGEVTKFNPFGAFVQITSEIQGLCHISEFGSQNKMEDDLKIGKKYDFKILLIDPKEHRMSLKLVQE